MYKPVAEGDTTTINALLNFYKKAYRIIGAAIFAFGLLVMPFLTSFIRGTYPQETNIHIIYFILLLNTAMSYWMNSYLISLLVVHQREDINSTRNMWIRISMVTGRFSLISARRQASSSHLQRIAVPRERFLPRRDASSSLTIFVPAKME